MILAEIFGGQFMYLHFLYERLVRLSPEAKFLLLRSLKHYGSLILPIKRASELAQDLGLGVKAVSKALEQMVEKGYLEKVKARVQGRRGRSSIAGFLSLEPLTALQKSWLANSRNVPHELLIFELIESESDCAKNSLTLANKLFLAVLLAHADDSGVIRDIGIAELMALTGMSRDRVGYQIDKLKRQGYIRSSVSGVTMPSIFGAASGYTFLNLFHSGFKKASCGGVIVLLRAELELETNYFREAKWICEVAARASRKGTGIRELEWPAECFGYKGELEGLLKFYNGITKAQEEYLQVRLNDYASHLLSNFWGELARLNWDSEVIFDKIYTDISCASANFRKNTGASPEELKSLAKFLFSVSLRIAKEVQRLLVTAGSHPYENMVCSILPYSIHRPSKGPGYAINICIQVFSKAIDGNLGYIKLGGPRFEKLVSVETGLEESLTFDTRCSAGLLSRNYDSNF